MIKLKLLKSENAQVYRVDEVVEVSEIVQPWLPDWVHGRLPTTSVTLYTPTPPHLGKLGFWGKFGLGSSNKGLTSPPWGN